MSPLRVMAGCRLYYRGGRTCTSRGRLEACASHDRHCGAAAPVAQVA